MMAVNCALVEYFDVESQLYHPSGPEILNLWGIYGRNFVCSCLVIDSTYEYFMFFS